MYNPYSLKDKTILVTGASSGIGRATAIECSKLGATLVLTGRNENGLQETHNLLDYSQGQLHAYYKADLTNETEIIQLVDILPVLDGLVCNAGVMKLTLTQFLTLEEIERVHR